MRGLVIRLREDRTDYRPGERLSGEAEWNIEGELDSVELRLFWYTDGRGSRDTETVDGFVWESARSADTRHFELTLPEEPYTYHGALISISWGLELVTSPGGDVYRTEIRLHPQPEKEAGE